MNYDSLHTSKSYLIPNGCLYISMGMPLFVIVSVSAGNIICLNIPLISKTMFVGSKVKDCTYFFFFFPAVCNTQIPCMRSCYLFMKEDMKNFTVTKMGETQRSC